MIYPSLIKLPKEHFQFVQPTAQNLLTHNTTQQPTVNLVGSGMFLDGLLLLVANGALGA